MNTNNEPSLDKIDDYNGNESHEKNKIVKLVIAGLLIIGGIYAGIKIMYNDYSDYVGTAQNPGIVTK